MDYLMTYPNLPSVLNMSYNTGTIAASTTNYLAIGGGTAGANATEANRQNIISTGGTLRNLYIATSTSQPAGGSLAFTLRKNGSDTGIVVTIAASTAAGTFSDTTNSVNVAPGDLLSLKAVNGSSSASAAIISASIGIY